jgi:hypothetical protein
MLRSYRDEGVSVGVAVGVPVGDVDVGAVHRWLDAGTPLSEIARRVGRPPGAIRGALRDAGLPVPPSRARRWTST